MRPHTIRGTILGASAVTARALLESPQLVDWTLLPKAIIGVVALLCGNGYIVGINQIYDVDIDVVNKPFLPIASGTLTVFSSQTPCFLIFSAVMCSGELSTGVAWGLVLALAAVGMAIVTANFGPLISSLYAFGLFLGTIYSIPPFR